MAMTKAYDVVAITGEYTNKQGEKKKQYLTIGKVLENEKGFSLKLDSIPLGWDGWAGMYVPKEQEPKQPVTSRTNDEFKDDIPF